MLNEKLLQNQSTQNEFGKLIKGLKTEEKIQLLGVLRSLVDSREKGEFTK